MTHHTTACHRRHQRWNPLHRRSPPGTRSTSIDASKRPDSPSAAASSRVTETVYGVEMARVECSPHRPERVLAREEGCAARRHPLASSTCTPPRRCTARHALHHSQVRAVLDDSIKARRGKKMEAVSSHYDHTTHRHVMGQQVLTLGLVSEEACRWTRRSTSQAAQSLNRRHKDRRSIGAQRYREASTRSKPQMALGRAKRSGIARIAGRRGSAPRRCFARRSVCGAADEEGGHEVSGPGG